MKNSAKLLNFEFIGLCLIGLFAFCNIAIFYNLFNYLQALGIQTELCGLVIGAYSLTAMVLFLVVSPFLNPANGLRTMLIGMVILVISGITYLFISSFLGLLLLRVFNGLGQFLLSASVTAMFVSVIPVEKSGQAFGLYSVAILLPYGIVPTLMDAFSTFFPTPAHGYAFATILFLPAALIVFCIGRRQKFQEPIFESNNLPTWNGIKTNITQFNIALLLGLSLIYFILWSSLFFLFKGFAGEQGIANVGSFFAVQMGVMIVIRLLAGRFFDVMNKKWLVISTFSLLAVGYLILAHLPGPWAVPFVAIIFGLGMGAGYPTMNGLMFEASSPAFRPLNANLILFAVQGGFFFGPTLNGAIVAHSGYHGYFLFSSSLCIAAAVFATLLSRRDQITIPS